MYGLNELNKTSDSIRQVEEQSTLTDGSSLNSCSLNESCRNNLKHLLHSYRFHLLIVGLVILDCIIVVIEIMIDLQLYQTENQSEEQSNPSNHSTAHSIGEVMHYSSIAILCIFTIEIIFKVYVFRTEYLHHWAEVFDAFIIITSLTLDLYFLHNKDVLKYIGLVIILRLWRIVRVIHGIAISVKTPLEHNYEKEKKSKEKMARDLAETHLYVNSLELEIIKLRTILKKNDITDEVPETYMKITRNV